MYQAVTGQRSFRQIAITAVLLAAGLAVIPATAPAGEPTTRRVRIADLDLASSQGRHALDRRLRLAIEQVCSPRGTARTRATTNKQTRDCRQAARQDVQRQLEQHGLSPLLAAGR